MQLPSGRRVAYWIAVIALVVAGVALVTWPESQTPAPTPRLEQPSHRLTDAEAIARFHELHALLEKAYRQRDNSFVHHFAVPGTRIEKAIERNTRWLIERDLLYRVDWDTQNLHVLSNDSERVVLRQIVTVTPKFVGEDDGKAIKRPVSWHQVVRWSLAYREGRWLFERGRVLESTRIRERPS